MLNVLPPDEILAGVAEVLRQRVLPAVAGANERRQCRAAAHLLGLLAEGSGRWDEVHREELRDFSSLVSASEDRSLNELRSEVADRLSHGTDEELVPLRLLVRRSLDRWVELTPPGPLGAFETLDQSPRPDSDVVG